MPQAAGRLQVLLLAAWMLRCTHPAPLPPAPGLSYPVKQALYTRGTPIAPIAPTLKGLSAASFSVSPPLPAGLGLNPATGVIGGTPTAVTATGEYVVTASDGLTQLTTTIRLAVKASQYQFSYQESPATYTRGEQIRPDWPIGKVPAAATFTISPALPEGLVLDAASGVLSGTPIVAMPVKEYRVSATNAEGTKSAHLSLTVLPGQPCAGTLLLGGLPALDVGPDTGAVASADLDGDGYQDLVVGSDMHNFVSVRLNRGDGTFAPAVSYTMGSADPNAGPWPVVLADLNGDGRPDLVAVVVYDSNEFRVRLNKGDGTFGDEISFSAGLFPTALAVGDMNRDGHPDLVVASGLRDGVVSVLPGRGDGTFGRQASYIVPAQPRSIGIADLNGDGWPDLVVGNGASVNLLLNQGDGTLARSQELPASTKWTAVVVGDLTGDGRPDLVVSTSEGGWRSSGTTATVPSQPPTYSRPASSPR